MAQTSKLRAPAEADTPPELPAPTAPKSLSAALLQAQIHVGSVGKTSSNDYDKYAYTSADTMVAACRDAFHAAGLLFYRSHFTIDRESDPPEVVSFFVVEYPPTDERRDYDPFPWPIVGNPKRLGAVDKSRAGALTTSLAYFQRDLLNVPRADSNEMDKREDVEVEPPAARATEASKLLQNAIAAKVGYLKDKRHLKTAGVYLDRAGHDIKLLTQVQQWVDRRVSEQTSAAEGATTPPESAAGNSSEGTAAAPLDPVVERVDPETGEILDADVSDDPESPLYGGRGDDGP